MPAWYPVKVNYLTGDVLTAANLHDLAGTVNLYDPTAKGDLFPATAADAVARLAVGANDTVLTADSTTATGLKWAAAGGGGGGTVHLKTATFSNVANTGTTFDALFTSAYNAYLLVYNNVWAATVTDDLLMQMRYAGPTTQADSYYDNYLTAKTTIVSALRAENAAAWRLTDDMNATTFGLSGSLTLTNVLSAGSYPMHHYSCYSAENEKFYTGGGYVGVSRVYTGFILSSSASNISGTVSVYGLVNA